MRWMGKGGIEFERDEPALRSCWTCNPAHEGLKPYTSLHMCFSCERVWCAGLSWNGEGDPDLTPEEFDAHFISLGLKPGESTRKLPYKGPTAIVLEIPEPRKG